MVVALDADLLLTESGGLAHARGFAAGRHGGDAPADGGGMNRLYAVESTLSITGAAADHRLRLPSGQIGAFALALAAELGVRGRRRRAGAAGGGAGAARGDRRRPPRRPRVGAGGRRPAAAGRGPRRRLRHQRRAGRRRRVDRPRPLTLHPLTDVGRGGEAELAGLATAMQGGEVQTLVVLGGNPVYGAPADLDFAAAFAQVPRTVHLSSHVDETSRAAAWHLPETHFLEQWGDVRSADGTLSAIQPLIAPLFDGAKSAIEVAGLLAGGTDRPGYDLVRETWQGGLLPGADFETAWRQALHDGVVAGSALPAVEAAADPARVAAAAQRLAGAASPSGDAAGGLELTFPVSRAVYDGRFANVAWLQELPDPLTKIVWDNAALVSPATAEDLGVASGDVVRLTYRGRSVEAPVWVLAGQADGSIALPLGYGRTAAGRVGDGVGVDAYRLRTADAPGFGRGLAVEPTGRTHALVQTQEHWQMEGRELVREATLAEFREHPEFAKEPDAELRLESLWKERAYDSGHQWGMAIDLNACIGCNACVDRLPGREQHPGGRQGAGGEEPRDAVAAGRPLLLQRRGRPQAGRRRPRGQLPADALPALRERPLRRGLPGGGDGARPRGHQRDGLQPLHRHPLLLEQLPLQGAPVQLLQLHQGHPGAGQAGDEPRRHGALARRDGEVHLLHPADQRGRRSPPSGRSGRSPTARSRPPASRPARRRRSSSATSATRRARWWPASASPATTPCSPS